MTAAENNSSAEFHLTFWKIRLIYRSLPPTPPSINPPFYQTLSLLVCLTEGETISQRPCRSIASIEQPQSGLFITSTLFFFFSSFSSLLPFILHFSAPLGIVVQVFDPCETRIKATYSFSLSLCLDVSRMVVRMRVRCHKEAGRHVGTSFWCLSSTCPEGNKTCSGCCNLSWVLRAGQVSSFRVEAIHLT